ncbi:DUF4282 domain-containing protein [Terrabacter terrigena]|uniref:DUF4282 domain-containing protein n=1 Tax=Terrabacter terrigena TaxID=574718 RepID=A0ABW3MSU2_9MICO
MSDQNPPEQPSFNRPAGSDPTSPLPTGSSGSPASPGSFDSPTAGPHPASTEPSARPSSPEGSTGPGSAPPPPPPPQAPSGHSSGPSGMSSLPSPAREGAGFFTALFDFSFTNFVTPILVRFVYLLATVALVATWLVLLFSGFVQGVGTGLAVLILGPIFLVIYLAVIRMTLEFYLSVVRMSEDIHKRLPQA